MKKLFILTLFLSVLSAGAGFAQATLYTQNFDSTLILPTDWYATPASWIIDSTAANSSTGYTGASGLNNVDIANATSPLGNDSLITGNIPTTGYNNITVEWATRDTKHFADSGATIAFYWSGDSGVTWNNMNYTENANNSVWAIDNNGTALDLPAGAANVKSLKLMWIANIPKANPSGTYRIDDLKVAGTAIPSGINNLSDASFAKVFMSSNGNINIAVQEAINSALTVNVYDLTGSIVYTSAMSSQNMTIPARQFSGGIYLVRLTGASQSMVTKILVK